MSASLQRAQESALGKFTKKASLGVSLILGLVLSTAAFAPTMARDNDKLIVQTAQGQVEGLSANGVTEFLGIPYAAPPVGDLRWRPPTPHAPWNSVLKATAYGPICAQSNEFGVFAGPANNNEDCLYLNVFTPTLKSSARLPVIVWIHGGGNVDGETPGYDGSKMAKQGHTVVVSMEYRLNAFGWLAHPALDQEGHLFGNYGLLDQQLALKWVQNNIAQFGGDKNNITLGGQSSGAINTGLNMVSPLAKGLFHRAICQSLCPGPLTPGGFQTTLATAEARGVAFAVAAGCGSGTDASTAKCLRNLTAAQVEAVAATGNYTGGQGIIDGQIIPILPMTAFQNGQFNHMPFMNGNTEDEETFFLAITEYNSNANNSLRTPPTAAQYQSYVNATFASPPYPAGTAAKILARYPVSAYSSPELAWDRVGTDSAICGQRILDSVLAPQIPVYAYEFDDQTAPFYFPQMPGFASLAYHTADIQYLFPLWAGGPNGIPHPLNKQQERLSDELVAAWTNFAWSGNPNGRGDSSWPRFSGDPAKPGWLLQNIPALSTASDKSYGAQRNCDLWAPLAYYTAP